MAYGQNTKYCVDCVKHKRSFHAFVDTCKVDGRKCIDRRDTTKCHKNVGYQCPDYQPKRRSTSIAGFVALSTGAGTIAESEV